MKFRDPKTGEVFEGIDRARRQYCVGRRCDIDSCRLAQYTWCDEWAENHPAEAARRMGLEVVEEPVKKLAGPRFTGDEIALAAIFHRQGVTELYRKEGHGLYWRGETDHGRLPMDLFSSIKVGETVKVEEVMEGSAAGKEQRK